MAIDLVDELDDWADAVSTATGLPVVIDPARIAPPCLFLDMPETVGVTLGALSLTQPVWLVAEGGGRPARDQLLTYLPAVLDALDATAATAGPLNIDGVEWHAYRIPTPLHVTEE